MSTPRVGDVYQRPTVEDMKAAVSRAKISAHLRAAGPTAWLVAAVAERLARIAVRSRGTGCESLGCVVVLRPILFLLVNVMCSRNALHIAVLIKCHVHHANTISPKGPLGVRIYVS